MSVFDWRAGKLALGLPLLAAAGLVAQGGGRGRGALGSGPATFPNKTLPFEPGFRVYIVSNMAGMGAAVDLKEFMSGTEPGAPASTNTASFSEYETRFRSLLTQEANAAVRGARLAGAQSFIVSDAHPGNAFGNILPWDLEWSALKP